jgi:hypothetical protein
MTGALHTVAVTSEALENNLHFTQLTLFDGLIFLELSN